MKGKMTPVTYIILFLVLVGIFSSLALLLLPLLVFGTIYLLYKYLPKRKRSMNSNANDARQYKETFKRQKERNIQRASFRVIKGSKRDDDEEPPLYH